MIDYVFFFLGDLQKFEEKKIAGGFEPLPLPPKPPTEAAPLHSKCFKIEDPSRKRIASTANLAKPATQR